jgi:hypothetical protein
MGATRSITKVAEQVHKNRQLMGRWSRTHTWPLRTIAFDKFNDREWQLTMREEADKANKRNAAIAAKIIKRVEAAKIQARALGMSTENLQVTGKGGGPVEVADVTLLSDEDRRARLQQLMTEAQRRLDEQGREAEAS